MGHAAGEVTTNVVDLTELSLAELRSSDDPVLLRSLTLVVDHLRCSGMGVLENQILDER
jgi:hypothetical protein